MSKSYQSILDRLKEQSEARNFAEMWEETKRSQSGVDLFNAEVIKIEKTLSDFVTDAAGEAGVKIRLRKINDSLHFDNGKKSLIITTVLRYRNSLSESSLAVDLMTGVYNEQGREAPFQEYKVIKRQNYELANNKDKGIGWISSEAGVATFVTSEELAGHLLENFFF